METYSLADLVNVTGAKRRSLQLWADREVIRPIPSTADAGTGVHRQYSRKEAIIACIIHGFALRQISIGELKFISMAIRAQMGLDADHLMEMAISGESPDPMLLWYESWHDSQKKKWVRRVSIGQIDNLTDLTKLVPDREQQDGLIMTIRLESYLAKLK